MSLGKDLAKIRNKQGLSIEDIKKSTRIPTHIIASIEDDSILEQLDNYTTYTRSYIRSYAKAIGIREEEIVAALDQVEQGTYQGSLRDRFDLEEAEAEQEDEEQEKAEAEEPEQPEKGDSKARKPKSKKTKGTPGPPKTPDNLDWVRVGMRAKATPSKSSIRTGLLVLLVLLALVAGGFIIYSLYYAEANTETNQPAETQTNQPQTPSDSLRQALINPQTNQPADTNTLNQTGSLPDTLTITILAADGKLEPVRVYTDILGQRNPYWVAEGDSLDFNFVNTVQVRAVNQYNRMQLLFNGHVIQNYYEEYFNEESGQVELNREVFENHPEWHAPSP